jgi:hypothetical protein
VSRSRPIGIAADLLFLHFPPCEYRGRGVQRDHDRRQQLQRPRLRQLPRQLRRRVPGHHSERRNPPRGLEASTSRRHRGKRRTVAMHCICRVSRTGTQGAVIPERQLGIQYKATRRGHVSMVRLVPSCQLRLIADERRMRPQRRHLPAQLLGGHRCRLMQPGQ